MKICFILIIFIFISVVGKCQFPPAAGINGSTAIHADSSIFIAWANKCYIQKGYQDIAQPELGFVSYGIDADALGKANNQVISLGDGGTAILEFQEPACDKSGFDFAVFENSFSDSFLELAHIEISSDSVHWFRFPSTSLTPTDQQIETFGSIDPTKINNLAGKYKSMYGTPFDISEIEDDIYLNKQRVKYIKIIDVVGSIDSSYASFDSHNNIINDPYPTAFNTGGFDLDAIGIIHTCPDQVETNTNNNFMIYPNPASDNIHLLIYPLNNYKITIISSLGTTINTISNQNNIDISTFEDGIYFLRLEIDNINFMYKFIKQ